MLRLLAVLSVLFSDPGVSCPLAAATKSWQANLLARNKQGKRLRPFPGLDSDVIWLTFNIIPLAAVLKRDGKVVADVHQRYCGDRFAICTYDESLH